MQCVSRLTEWTRSVCFHASLSLLASLGEVVTGGHVRPAGRHAALWALCPLHLQRLPPAPLVLHTQTLPSFPSLSSSSSSTLELLPLCQDPLPTSVLRQLQYVYHPHQNPALTNTVFGCCDCVPTPYCIVTQSLTSHLQDQGTH